MLTTFFFHTSGKPTKPLSLFARNKTSSTITITWTHGKHSQNIIYTNIEYFKTSGDSSKTKDVYQLKSRDNFYTIKNLDAYTEYQIDVITCVQSGSKILCSDPSNSIKERTKIKGKDTVRKVLLSHPAAYITLEIQEGDLFERGLIRKGAY